MSRALIIKNANFSANRVAVITFDSKPCTAISFTEHAITVTGDEPISVEYTVTPANTTDDIIWSSSNVSVATVNNGEVTINGIGETTLTATCGNFSDSLVLTVDLYAVPDWYCASPSIITDNAGNSIVRADLSTSATARVFAAQDADNTDYTLPFYNTNDNGLASYPIRIPNNCNKMHISASNLYSNSHSIFFVNATEQVTYAGSAVSCEAISDVQLTASNYAVDMDVSVPEGANGFAIKMRLRNAPAEGATIQEAGASTSLSVHFVAE